MYDTNLRFLSVFYWLIRQASSHKISGGVAAEQQGAAAELRGARCLDARKSAA